MLTRKMAVAVVLSWAMLGLAMHAFAPTFNGLKPGGVPLGYWLSAQGAPLLMGLLLLWLAAARGRTP